MSSPDPAAPITRNRSPFNRAWVAAGVLLAPLAVLAALLGALAGCGAAGRAPGAANAPTQTVQQQARTVWLHYAQCVREHGAPNFPDPHVDSQGHASFDQTEQTKAEALQAQGACGSILSRLPASVTSNAPVTAAQLRQLTEFARCMRQHGLPRWPDPRPDGTFPLTATPYANMGKSPAILAAWRACSRFDPSGSISGS